MFDWINFVAQDRYRELRRNIEAEQLVREAMAAEDADRQHFTPFYYEQLAALGRRLSAVGDDLQSRFGEDGALPLEQLRHEQG